MRPLAFSIFLALCFLDGSLWLLPVQAASFLSTVVVNAGGGCLLAAAVAAVLLSRGTSRSLMQTRSYQLAAWGTGAIGVPGFLLLLGRQRLSGVLETAIMAAAPLLVALVLSTAGTANASLQEMLLPVLLTLSGALLLLPVMLPGSLNGWIGFAFYGLAAVSVAVCSVRSHQLMQGHPLLEGFSAVAFGNALFALLICVCLLAVGPRELTGSFLVQYSGAIVLSAVAEAALIAVLYLQYPLGAAARFPLATLIAATEAYLLLRPSLSFRTAAGAAMIFVGVISCLRVRPASQTASTMSLR